MDCKSLMIGDWVHIAPSVAGRNDYDIQVCGVGEDVVLVRKESGLDCIDYERVKPIPLTAEILEKNGWKCTNKQIWDSDYYVNAIFEYDEITHSHLTLQQFDEFGMFVFGVNYCLWEGFSCWYVHELQHALRLCGLNELADNFRV